MRFWPTNPYSVFVVDQAVVPIKSRWKFKFTHTSVHVLISQLAILTKTRYRKNQLEMMHSAAVTYLRVFHRCAFFQEIRRRLNFGENCKIYKTYPGGPDSIVTDGSWSEMVIWDEDGAFLTNQRILQNFFIFSKKVKPKPKPKSQFLSFYHFSKVDIGGWVWFQSIELVELVKSCKRFLIRLKTDFDRGRESSRKKSIFEKINDG